MQDPYEDEDDYELKPSEGKADNGRVRLRRVDLKLGVVCPGRRGCGSARPGWMLRASNRSLPSVVRLLIMHGRLRSGATEPSRAQSSCVKALWSPICLRMRSCRPGSFEGASHRQRPDPFRCGGRWAQCGARWRSWSSPPARLAVPEAAKAGSAGTDRFFPVSPAADSGCGP